MNLQNKLSLCLFFTIFFAARAFPQAQIDSGNLKGTIYDSTRAVIPNAQVTVADEAKGIRRTAIADASGKYQVLLLRPGTYAVQVSASGFETQIKKDVQITVGQATTLDFEVAPGQFNTAVEVTAEVPVVETERTQQADTIEERRIEDLPINRRDFLDFALLTPGVTDSNTLVDDTDFRISQAPQSGLSFAGSNGRGNYVSIDGASNIYNSGGVRPTITQAAVQEFQINRSNYTAEFGGATGGVVNIVSKSGTNALHGEVFGFLRARVLEARNFFEEQNPPYTRVQTGFGIGGPIKKDKTFFFVGFELLDNHQSIPVPILSRSPGIFSSLTDSQSLLLNFLDTQALTYHVISSLLRPALLTTSYPQTVALFQANSGVFPFSKIEPQMIVKIDHNFSDRQMIFVRENWTMDHSDDTQFGSLVAYNRGRSLRQFDNTAVFSDTFLASPQTVNQFRFSWGYNMLSVIPNDPNGPEIDITGSGLFGRDIYLPSRTQERSYQTQDTYTSIHGKHTLKFGGEYYATRDFAQEDSFFSGDFSFGNEVPLYDIIAGATSQQTVTALNNFLLTTPGVPAGLTSTVPVTLPGSTTPTALSAALASPITALQSFNLGLPEYYQQGFGNPDFGGWSNRFFFFIQDDWKPKPNLTVSAGLRYEIYSEISPFGTYLDKFAPRLGASWDPFSDGKTAIRGGVGLFYTPIDSQIGQVVNTLNGTHINQTFAELQPGIPGSLNPMTGQPVTALDIYDTLLSEGVIGHGPITAADLQQFGITPGPGAPGSVIFEAAKGYTLPYSAQGSFSIEHQLGSNFELSASYLLNRTVHLPRAVDINVYKTGTDPDTGLPTYGFYNPNILQLNQYQSSANSFYNAMILSATKRFSSHYSFSGFYTYSKSTDDVTDFNSDYEANDQTDLRADHALSSFDQRHRVVLNGVLDVPSERVSNHLLSKVLKNVQVAPIFTYASARPFNLLVGYDDVGDNHPNTHRPLGAGRNIGIGPDLITMDLRISKQMHLTERLNLQLLAEAFNLFNHTNFKSVNNTVGDVTLVGTNLINTTGQSINNGSLQGNENLLPTQPMGFTSAFDARQFQLGLKILF